VSGNSSGGMGAARGEGHQARCAAWAAAYLLTEERLPDFALGRRIRVIGAQTKRSVDDLAILTDEDGWVLIQAKKGLRLTSSPGGALAAALGQAVELARVGLPIGPNSASRKRPVEPKRDRVLIVSDETAARTVGRDLRAVVDRLRTLSLAVPLDETARNENERTGLALLRQHLGNVWQAEHGSAMSELDLREMCRSLGVQVLDLSDGGSHRAAAEQLLRTLLPTGDVSTLWELLLAEGHRVAREGTYLDRDELVRRLAALGIVLSPVSRLRPDIQRLQERTITNLVLLGRDLFISAPDGVVDVERSAMAHLATAGGNVAITGGSGTGKSTELHRTAIALCRRGLDVVVLRADDLRGTGGQTRLELNLAHDLADVLLGWSGADGATLMLDGLDQTRGEDVSPCISTVAHRLAGTRWRIVATIRSYDLRHSPRWRSVFAGTPVDPANADPTLAHCRHVWLGDFTDAELALVSAQSVRLASVLDRADPGLCSLLANPFNLGLAAQLLRGEDLDDLDLSTVRSRIDLLDQFWAIHAYRHDATRIDVLRAVVIRMVKAGRQTIGADLVNVDHAVLRSLCSDGVLRELPLISGHAAPGVEFTHPVLFDYAVALLALSDPAQQAGLADVLDQRPNHALALRPSIKFRLAMIWRQDETRAVFWRLGARLAARGRGHPLVALQAAQVSVSELRTVAECSALADLCVAAAHRNSRLWTVKDARQLAYLVAVLAGRADGPHVAEVIADFAGTLAARAEEVPDLALAQLATQVSLRLVNLTGPNLNERLATVATRCAALALAHRHHTTSPLVAESASQVLAHVAFVGGRRTVSVIRRMCHPNVLRSWGGGHLRALIDRIADAARVDPDLAVTICTCAWDSAKTNRQQQANHDIRTDVGQGFAALADTDLMAATALLLKVVESPDMYLHPSNIEFDDPPRPRTGASLQYPIRHAAQMMTAAWIDRLRQMAERTEPALAHGTVTVERATFSTIVEQVVANLRHADVWAQLLHHAVAADDSALAHGLLPALTSPNLYLTSSTWVAAAHLARRLSPSLDPNENAAIEWAVRNIERAGRRMPADDDEFRREFRGRTDVIRSGVLPPLSEPDGDDEATWRQADPADSQNDSARQPDLNEFLYQSAGSDQGERASAISALVDAWPGPMEHRMRLSVAARLAQEPEVSPTSPPGPGIYKTLRSVALPDPTAESPVPTTLGTVPGSLVLPWTPDAEALNGLVGLACRSEWRAAHKELTSLLTPFLGSLDPAHRYRVSPALPYLLPKTTDLVNELGRRLAAEPNRYVAAILLQVLNRHIGSRAADVDSMLGQLIFQSTWAYPLLRPGLHDHGGQEIIDAPFAIVTELAVTHGTTIASDLMRAWLDRPDKCHQQIGHVMLSHRDVLNPADESRRSAQRSAFTLLEHGARACRDTLRTLKLKQAADVGAVGSDDAFNVAWAAGVISRGIHLASGALDHPSPQPTERGDPALFYDLALPVLTVLSEIPDPAVTRTIVETCIALVDHRPDETLKLVANAVTGDETFSRELIGLDRIVTLAQRYLADYRGLLRDDEACLTALRQLLEVSILTGWDQAIDLTEELDDLFG